ncbi:hypothetical protein D9757_004650 [Collybiopsis confluens]|uniref:Uncharacterized protein n=1 Tax=Collybiopsis confluens TaxID=2823264 RepID=A0A8H5HS91_9AGAR|nr:hypothetical protein D9757_004650 [Collybiopsis confluens]
MRRQIFTCVASLTLDLAYLWTPFITLHIVGQVGTTILLLTYVLSKNIRRHCSLVNFWVCLIYASKSAGNEGRLQTI